MSDKILCTNDTLFYIQKQFFAAINLKLFNWKDALEKCCTDEGETNQQLLLDCTVLHEVNQKHPVRLPYQLAFLKHWLNHLEAHNVTVGSTLYETYCSLLNTVQEPNVYLHFYKKQPEKPIVSVRETVTYISNGTTGLSTWPAARVLAEYALQNSPIFTGKRVLELGCGTGLLGLSIIRETSPNTYYFTDCHIDVLNLVTVNIKLNLNIDVPLDKEEVTAGTTISVINLPWENVTEDVAKRLLPDVVVASDVVYDISVVDALVSVLRLFSAVGHCVDIYVACAERNGETLETFVKGVAREGGRVCELCVPESEVFFYTCDVPVRIYKIGF